MLKSIFKVEEIKEDEIIKYMGDYVFNMYRSYEKWGD